MTKILTNVPKRLIALMLLAEGFQFIPTFHRRKFFEDNRVEHDYIMIKWGRTEVSLCPKSMPQQALKRYL